MEANMDIANDERIQQLNELIDKETDCKEIAKLVREFGRRLHELRENGTVSESLDRAA
jgi:hypothetical protein